MRKVRSTSDSLFSRGVLRRITPLVCMISNYRTSLYLDLPCRDARYTSKYRASADYVHDTIPDKVMWEVAPDEVE
jgi:hypothetical protein